MNMNVNVIGYENGILYVYPYSYYYETDIARKSGLFLLANAVKTLERYVLCLSWLQSKQRCIIYGCIPNIQRRQRMRKPHPISGDIIIQIQTQKQIHYIQSNPKKGREKKKKKVRLCPGVSGFHSTASIRKTDIRRGPKHRRVYLCMPRIQVPACRWWLKWCVSQEKKAQCFFSIYTFQRKPRMTTIVRMRWEGL